MEVEDDEDEELPELEAPYFLDSRHLNTLKIGRPRP